MESASAWPGRTQRPAIHTKRTAHKLPRPLRETSTEASLGPAKHGLRGEPAACVRRRPVPVQLVVGRERHRDLTVEADGPTVRDFFVGAQLGVVGRVAADPHAAARNRRIPNRGAPPREDRHDLDLHRPRRAVRLMPRPFPASDKFGRRRFWLRGRRRGGASRGRRLSDRGLDRRAERGRGRRAAAGPRQGYPARCTQREPHGRSPTTRLLWDPS